MPLCQYGIHLVSQLCVGLVLQFAVVAWPSVERTGFQDSIGGLEGGVLFGTASASLLELSLSGYKNIGAVGCAEIVVYHSAPSSDCAV